MAFAVLTAIEPPRFRARLDNRPRFALGLRCFPALFFFFVVAIFHALLHTASKHLSKKALRHLGASIRLPFLRPLCNFQTLRPGGETLSQSRNVLLTLIGLENCATLYLNDLLCWNLFTPRCWHIIFSIIRHRSSHFDQDFDTEKASSLEFECDVLTTRRN